MPDRKGEDQGLENPLSRIGVPETFAGAERDKAEFWAWLAEGYIVRVPTNTGPEDPAGRGKVRIVSKETIRQLISEALEADDRGRADELLQLASNSQELSKELVRKSIRVEKGEYLKLLYVKLIENTSFSDVILKLLQKPAKSFVSSLRSHLSPTPQRALARLDHVHSLIDTWGTAKPESRSRSVDLSSVVLDETGFLPVHYSQKLDDVKPVVSAYVLAEVERRFFQPHFPTSRKVYEEEFQATWRTSIEESIPSGVALKPTPSPKDPDTVLFTPVLQYYDSLDPNETQKLFEKYGDETILAFASSFQTGRENEAYNEYIHKLREADDFRLNISWEVELPPCSATVKGPASIEVENQPDPAMAQHISEDEMIMWKAIEKVAKGIGIDPNAYFSQERGAGKRALLAGSSHLTDFVKLATKTASSPEDFSNIRNITTYRNRLLSYQKVKSFLEDLVDQTLSRRSVVSFYVNTDVWRLIPLVMENKSWISLADEFLKSRPVLRGETKKTGISTGP